MPLLQILISTYGPDGLENIASLPHPSHPQVEYLVNWQKSDKKKIPESLLKRNDFFIYHDDSVGLCNNRNNIISKATAPFVLISDEDVEYTFEQIDNLISALPGYTDYGFLSFEYISPDNPKPYPDCPFDYPNSPKGFFVSSIEIVLNLKLLRERNVPLFFNPAFGLNGIYFPCGEEDLLIASLMRKGLKGRFINLPIAIHSGPTTSDKLIGDPVLIKAKGAAMGYLFPSSWPLRMICHAWRAYKAKGVNHYPFFRYCKWWIAGWKKARQTKIFDNY